MGRHALKRPFLILWSVVIFAVTALALYLGTIGYYPGIADDMAALFRRPVVPDTPIELVYSGVDYAAVSSAVSFDAAFFFRGDLPRDFLAASCPPSWGLREGFPARFEDGRWTFRLLLDPADRRITRSLAPFMGLSSRKTLSFADKLHRYVANFAITREPVVHVTSDAW